MPSRTTWQNKKSLSERQYSCRGPAALNPENTSSPAVETLLFVNPCSKNDDTLAYEGTTK
jgi:hypothetical protein